MVAIEKEKSQVVRARVEKELFDQLSSLDGTIAEHVRAALVAYLSDQERKGELLAIEQRFAASFQRTQIDLAEMRKDLNLSLIMIDFLAQFEMFTLPEHPDRATADAVGSRRYNAFRKELASRMSGKKSGGGVDVFE